MKTRILVFVNRHCIYKWGSEVWVQYREEWERNTRKRRARPQIFIEREFVCVCALSKIHTSTEQIVCKTGNIQNFGTHSYSNKVTSSVKLKEKWFQYKLTCDVAICSTVWWNSQIRLRSFKKLHTLWLGFIQGMKDF